MPHVQEALNCGLLPDDNTLMQLSQEKDSIVHGRSLDTMRWPDSDLRAVLIRELVALVPSSYCPAVQHTLPSQLLWGL